MKDKVLQIMMSQVINLFGCNHIRTIDVLRTIEILIEIKTLEPTMVPAFLLDVDIVKIISHVVLVNKVEEVTMSEYYNMEGLLLGNAVLYKGDIVIEISNLSFFKTGSEVIELFTKTFCVNIA